MDPGHQEKEISSQNNSNRNSVTNNNRINNKISNYRNNNRNKNRHNKNSRNIISRISRKNNMTASTPPKKNKRKGKKKSTEGEQPEKMENTVNLKRRDSGENQAKKLYIQPSPSIEKLKSQEPPPKSPLNHNK